MKELILEDIDKIKKISTKFPSFVQGSNKRESSFVEKISRPRLVSTYNIENLPSALKIEEAQEELEYPDIFYMKYLDNKGEINGDNQTINFKEKQESKDEPNNMAEKLIDHA